MTTPSISFTLAVAAMSVASGRALAQDVSELVSAGRFEEAAALLSGAGPGEADRGATLIFDEAYQNGFQQGDFEYCIRGMRAAKQIPSLSQPQRELLDFWHGFSIFQLAMPLASPQNVASAQRTLPMFREALALIQASGTYPESREALAVMLRSGRYPDPNDMDIATLVEGLQTFIEIQEAIIRRGY